MLGSGDDMDDEGDDVELVPLKAIRKKKGKRTERFLPPTKI